MTNMPSLVPQDLLSEDDAGYESRRLLEELAAELASATHDSVVGEVRTSYPHGRVEHEFSLRSQLSRYRYDLFWLSHGLDEFPVEIRGPWEGHAEHYPTLDQLREGLRLIFDDARTRRLINQMAKTD